MFCMWQVLIRVFLAVRFRVSVPFGSTRLDLPQNCNSKWPTRWAQIRFLCGVKWGSFFTKMTQLEGNLILVVFATHLQHLSQLGFFFSKVRGLKKKTYLKPPTKCGSITWPTVEETRRGTLRAHGDATFAKLRQLLAALPNVQMPAKGSKGMSSRMLRFSKNGYIHHPKNIH